VDVPGPHFGIDVSKWQGDIDWERVGREAGLSFATARATMGREYVDEKWHRNLDGMRKSGIPVIGAYHFLRTAWTVQDQVSYFLEALGGSPKGLLIQLDVETAADGTKAGVGAVGRWLDEWRARTDNYPVIMYTGRWYWQDHLGDPDGRGLKVPLWHSRYLPATVPSGTVREMFPHVPQSYWSVAFGGWTSPTILQFTSSGRVQGIQGNVDLNAFRGTLAELKTLTRS
jgi:lysozyme